MKLVFFGTSKHSAHFLDIIGQRGLKPDLVISTPPKIFGRQRILTCNPAVLTAKAYGIPYLENLEDIFNYPNPTVGVILDFKHIIGKPVIDYFEQGIINIHFSKLPAYRGASPVQCTILNGDNHAWISYFLINEKLDEGKILAQTSLPLNLKETTDELYEILTEKAAQEFPGILEEHLSGKIKAHLQKGKPSYCGHIKTIDCRINWQHPDKKIERLIRAAQPEPGAWTEVLIPKNGKTELLRLKICQAHLKSGKLVLDQVQLEGKNPVSFKQFQEGYPNAKLI